MVERGAQRFGARGLPPCRFDVITADADGIRDEKLKVLKALRPITRDNVDEKTVRDLIPVLKKEGASGIVEYPLNKVIP